MLLVRPSPEPQDYQWDEEEVHRTLYLLHNQLLLPAATAATLLSLPLA